jgi:hypothetical protein
MCGPNLLDDNAGGGGGGGAPVLELLLPPQPAKQNKPVKHKREAIVCPMTQLTRIERAIGFIERLLRQSRVRMESLHSQKLIAIVMEKLSE